MATIKRLKRFRQLHHDASSTGKYHFAGEEYQLVAVFDCHGCVPLRVHEISQVHIETSAVTADDFTSAMDDFTSLDGGAVTVDDFCGAWGDGRGRFVETFQAEFRKISPKA